MKHLFLFGAFMSLSFAQAQISIIPEPVKITENQGVFELTDKTVIAAGGRLGALGEMLSDYLSGPVGFYIKVAADTRHNESFIQLKLNDKLDSLGDEGYRLTVDKNKVLIESAADAGIFYGMQTLRQLLPAAIYREAPAGNEKWQIPCCVIEDKPRFGWRGMHLDPARYFMPVEFVKKYIDLIAMHKMNRFHWHLTEDQGWRIEIEKYPKLTEISAWRDETLIGHARNKPHKFDGKRHGGFYSKQDVREIVAYAKARFVTVVPEIEMPGHSLAALAAYPELSCTGGPFEVQKSWGVFPDVYCAGKEETFEFLTGVLDEVLELFPSEFIHIGGDECPKDRWKECPDCQKRIRDEGLADEHELQSWFVKRMEKYLSQNGRRLIGWDEILEGGIAPGATVMSWRGVKGGIEAADTGHDVVMAPNTYTYFDYYQVDKDRQDKEPLGIGGYLPLEKVYSFEPVPDEIDTGKEKHILGAQGQLWGEYIPNPKHAEYMAFPRACALAEVVWTEADKKDYKGFLKRLEAHLKRLGAMDVNYRKPD
jgi:hexosaminidase